MLTHNETLIRSELQRLHICSSVSGGLIALAIRINKIRWVLYESAVKGQRLHTTMNKTNGHTYVYIHNI